jgi:hypothetical protein
MEGTPQHDRSSSNSIVFKCNQTINLKTRAKDYDNFEPTLFVHESISSSNPSGPLLIENPSFDTPLFPMKSVLRKMTHNPNTWYSHNYNIVEYLAQEPCAMSTLKVLQSYPMHRKDLLSSISRVDPSESSLIKFYSDQVHDRISHQIAFQIKVRLMEKNILHTVTDEGASTCIMSMSCLKALGSPKLDTYATLLKSFCGHMLYPHGIITALPIELGGKTLFIVLEVIDAPLEYNLLPGCTWLYEMIVVVSSVFRVLRFLHQGKIVTIDQLAFCTPNLGSNAGSNVPFVDETQQSYMSVGARMFKDYSLMGLFQLLSPPPSMNISPINMIS